MIDSVNWCTPSMFLVSMDRFIELIPFIDFRKFSNDGLIGLIHCIDYILMCSLNGFVSWMILDLQFMDSLNWLIGLTRSMEFHRSLWMDSLICFIGFHGFPLHGCIELTRFMDFQRCSMDGFIELIHFVCYLLIGSLN